MKNTIVDPFLNDLLQSASKALFEEEAQLANAFAKRQRPLTRFGTERHGDKMQGLAYPVYETTLCYTIFKRWLEVAKADDVLWDWHPKVGSGQLVDLQVVGPSALYRFEAKWWGRVEALERDREKLSRHEGSKDCLLAFWWDAENAKNRDRDAKAVAAAQGRLQAPGVFLSSFATRCHPDVNPKEWYFAFAAFELH